MPASPTERKRTVADEAAISNETHSSSTDCSRLELQAV